MSEHKKKKWMMGDEISVEDIPANVMEAVNKAMPGGTIKFAMKKDKGDKVIYMVKKLVEDDKYMIKVTDDGKLLAVLGHDMMMKMWKGKGHGHKDKEHGHKHKEHGHKHKDKCKEKE